MKDLVYVKVWQPLRKARGEQISCGKEVTATKGRIAMTGTGRLDEEAAISQSRPKTTKSQRCTSARMSAERKSRAHWSKATNAGAVRVAYPKTRETTRHVKRCSGNNDSGRKRYVENRSKRAQMKTMPYSRSRR